MAVQNGLLDLSWPAGEDLTGKQFRFVKLNDEAKCVVCASGDTPLGVLQNNPAIGESAGVRLIGTTKLMTAGAAALMAGLGVGADGKATSGGTNAITLEAATADGDIITALLK